ncbi:MAG: GGGtGRT protein, partial [Clostridia bacterium]
MADNIKNFLKENKLQSIREAKDICEKAGINVLEIVRGIQPIAFDNAVDAFTLGTAACINLKIKSAHNACLKLGEALEAFCKIGSVADNRKVGTGHGNLAAMLLSEKVHTFCFLAGHESFAAAEGAIGIALSANKVRKTPLKVILNGLGKEAANIIARINGFTYVKTNFDHKTEKLEIESEKSFSTGEKSNIKIYGAFDSFEGVAIMKKEMVDVAITGNSTNPTRFQHPTAAIYKKWCQDNGKTFFAVASGGGTGRTLHPDNLGAGPASYGLTDLMGKMYADAKFAG